MRCSAAFDFGQLYLVNCEMTVSCCSEVNACVAWGQAIESETMSKSMSLNTSRA